MLKKIKRKLKLNSGFTLTEMLCVTIVMVLVSGCLTLGISLSKNSLESTTTFSRLQMLTSTLTNAISDELRYAKDMDISSSNRLKSYTSETFGTESIIKVNDQGQVVITSKSYTTEYPLIASSAYANGKISKLSIKYDGTYFTVTIKVTAANGMTKDASFMIKALNPA